MGPLKINLSQAFAGQKEPKLSASYAAPRAISVRLSPTWPLALNHLDLPAEALNGAHRRIRLAVLTLIVEHSEHTTCAAVEGNVRQRKLALTAGEAAGD